MEKYSVSQTFVIFGDPCQENFSDLNKAEKYADELAEGIAHNFWTKKNDRVVSVVSEEISSGTGMSNEVEFSENLPWVCDNENDWSIADEYDSISMPWDDLVDCIRTEAIEIEKNTEE